MERYGKVSIVIPTYNREQYLKQCIISCLNQTHPCEIIVCDHGSKDGTPEMVKQFADKIKYVRREKDSGVHFCWLDGILHASNEFIHINFDDDWIEPTFIERCISLFDEEVGCVFSDARVYYAKELKFSDNLFRLGSSTGKYPAQRLINFNLASLTSPGAGIFRRKVLLDSLFVGKIPFTKNKYKGVGPDLLFTLMSCLEYRYFGFVNEPLAIFRAHESSITIDASSNFTKTFEINKAYDDARIYFLIHKWIFQFKAYGLAKRVIKMKRKK